MTQNKQTDFQKQIDEIKRLLTDTLGYDSAVVNGLSDQQLMDTGLKRLKKSGIDMPDILSEMRTAKDAQLSVVSFDNQLTTEHQIGLHNSVTIIAQLLSIPLPQARGVNDDVALAIEAMTTAVQEIESNRSVIKQSVVFKKPTHQIGEHVIILPDTTNGADNTYENAIAEVIEIVSRAARFETQAGASSTANEPTYTVSIIEPKELEGDILHDLTIFRIM